MRKVCIFTSTRAEWGLLQGVAEEVNAHEDLQLQLLVSGSHLSDRFGMTVSEIESAGFQINERADILKFEDNTEGICKTMGLALASYSEAFNRLMPDVLLLLGDRYETFCAAAAAQIHRIPVAHIHGGETTEGAVDEAFRHSITKMAQLHFPSCETYRRRIIQLGESPARVFNVGALGVENIRKTQFVSKAQLESVMGFALDHPFFLITFHPVTLEQATAAQQCDTLFHALDRFPEYKAVFTEANADAGGSVINEKVQAYVRLNPDRCIAFSSLGAIRYLSAMKLCTAVIGNSSSGILETPVFGIPTVNIGDRQKGRERMGSVIDCAPDTESLITAIQHALDPEFREEIQNMINPCDKAHTAKNFVQAIVQHELSGLMKKSFHNLPGEYGV